MGSWPVSWIRHTRYNHALEHATLHLLQRRFPRAWMAGFSDGKGITFYSELTAEEILPALHEALTQLRNGAVGLAVHPNCGTNLVASASLAVAASWLSLALTPRRSLVERFLQAVLMTMGALLLAPQVGTWLQARVTTDAALPEAQVSSLFADGWGKYNRVRVNLRYGL